MKATLYGADNSNGLMRLLKFNIQFKKKSKMGCVTKKILCFTNFTINHHILQLLSKALSK